MKPTTSQLYAEIATLIYCDEVTNNNQVAANRLARLQQLQDIGKVWG